MISKNVLFRRTAAVVLAVAVAAVPGVAVAAVPSPAARADDHAALRPLVNRLTAPGGAPGALAEVDDRHGSSVLTSGVADVRTGAPVHPESRFRIGSLTKPFVATVVLQLVGEGRVELDAPVERYLPGVVRGADTDGQITVRQLLQHTSGLPDVMDYLTPNDILKDPLRHWEARELVDIALPQPRTFDPGQGWDYSNTNYLLAGMIIERVTGHSYGTEIKRRVLVPLKLKDTIVPGDMPGIPRPHPQGYVRTESGLLDVTRLNPTVAGAGGGMISSASDVNTFLAALLDGDLLKPPQLREMLKTHPTGRSSKSEYGLGLEWIPACGDGDGYWGHDGDMLGFSVRAGVTTDGRQATVMVNRLARGGTALATDLGKVVPAAFCEQ